MGTPILRCRHCGHWYTVHRVIPSTCPSCEQSAHWTTDTSTKAARFVLSENDRRFLRGIHIKPEADGET